MQMYNLSTVRTLPLLFNYASNKFIYGGFTYTTCQSGNPCYIGFPISNLPKFVASTVGLFRSAIPFAQVAIYHASPTIDVLTNGGYEKHPAFDINADSIPIPPCSIRQANGVKLAAIIKLQPQSHHC